jgi:MFS family permease
MFLATIPAVLYVDQWGRKKTLIAGAIGMGLCHFIVGGIIATCQDNWGAHKAAGWAAVVFVWVRPSSSRAWTLLADVHL